MYSPFLEKATSLLTHDGMLVCQPLLRYEDNHLQALGKLTRIANDQYIEWMVIFVIP